MPFSNNYKVHDKHPPFVRHDSKSRALCVLKSREIAFVEREAQFGYDTTLSLLMKKVPEKNSVSFQSTKLTSCWFVCLPIRYQEMRQIRHR